ncbi:MAG: hypothetical protein KAQ72_15775 [Desulfobacula sp.]|nr:hypothetical protein [Desulfobacula sp.]
MNNKNFRVVWFSYIIFSVLFGTVIAMTFSYAPFESSDSVIQFGKEWISNYSSVYLLLNFFISVIIVLLILIFKNKLNITRFVIFLMLLLLILDLVPAAKAIQLYFSIGSVDIPWTIIILFFHSYLLLIWKNGKERT